jgi:hypothetical protein
VFQILIRDPGSGAFLTPLDPGSEMNNPDHISESLETIFWAKILKFFYTDPGYGMEKIRIRDGKIRIRDKHPGSAALVSYLDHDGEADPGRLSLEGVQALVLPVIAVDDGHVGRLHDQLRGRLDPHVPVKKHPSHEAVPLKQKNTFAASVISLEVDLIPMSLFKISIS